MIDLDAGLGARHGRPIHRVELAALEGVRGDADCVALGVVTFKVAGRELGSAGRRVAYQEVAVGVGGADGDAAAAVACVKSTIDSGLFALTL